MGRERAPFTCDAWSSAELQGLVSKVAGIDLVQAFGYEIANINISVNQEYAEDAGTEKTVDTSAFA
ncbi:uncharacterized protein N7469_003414 [Penicillium citrinum]|uniref:Uncharacterized protein n=1 Tax=Penicillium citrinum TaxID=5077 RepID=A0A9W9TPJ6_PENCI|nr:uncharacterized protein N7469_003414 [Penicillium citrinum]KAJ5234246.1 hypothetical protein N7469_003414 [Penicillium citrinum]